MGKNTKTKLTLNQPAEYRIKVPGHLDESWLEDSSELTVERSKDDAGFPFTTFTGKFDQAALIRTLRRLYSWGLPLISVFWMDGF